MEHYCSASNGAVNQLRRGCPHADGFTTKKNRCRLVIYII
ncbi:hypothetical protein [Klebsiella pneumoniae IS53]|nr:hypothetical protein [Klebsiella pneumoniae IS53]